MANNIAENILKSEIIVDDSKLEKYLTFTIENQVYAIPSSQIIEIIPMQSTTVIPKLPEFVKGVINLRGKIIPVINLRMRLRKPEKEYDSDVCIIIVETNEITVGLIVDCVNDVMDINCDSINEYSKLTGDFVSNYISGICTIDEKAIMILNTIKVFIEE